MLATVISPISTVDKPLCKKLFGSWRFRAVMPINTTNANSMANIIYCGPKCKLGLSAQDAACNTIARISASCTLKSSLNEIGLMLRNRNSEQYTNSVRNRHCQRSADDHSYCCSFGRRTTNFCAHIAGNGKGDDNCRKGNRNPYRCRGR